MKALTILRAEPEYPDDGATDARGWTEVSGVYRVPKWAKQAVVELEFCWAPQASTSFINDWVILTGGAFFEMIMGGVDA